MMSPPALLPLQLDRALHVHFEEPAVAGLLAGKAVVDAGLRQWSRKA
jgi:hypothetical protein